VTKTVRKRMNLYRYFHHPFLLLPPLPVSIAGSLEARWALAMLV
jgi:hypothetical protein